MIFVSQPQGCLWVPINFHFNRSLHWSNNVTSSHFFLEELRGRRRVLGWTRGTCGSFWKVQDQKLWKALDSEIWRQPLQEVVLKLWMFFRCAGILRRALCNLIPAYWLFFEWPCLKTPISRPDLSIVSSFWIFSFSYWKLIQVFNWYHSLLWFFDSTFVIQK